MVKVGLRAANFPVQEEFDVLISHIYENFPGHTLPEIRLAFEMAMADKLRLKDGANCFENFSCIYFSTIMNAYRKWSREVPPPKEELQQPRFYTDEELDNIKREDAERQYQLFLRGYELRGIEINKTILEKDKLLTFFPEEYKDGFRIDGCYESVIDFFKRKAEAGFRNIYKKEKE